MKSCHLGACLLAMVLSACGGGGGDDPEPFTVKSVDGYWDVYRAYDGEPEHGPDLTQWSNSGTGYGIKMDTPCSTYVLPHGWMGIAGEIHDSSLTLTMPDASWNGTLADDLSSMSGTFTDLNGSGVWRAQKLSSSHPCATYEVYGGDQSLSCGGIGGYNPEGQAYTFLGASTSTKTFPGTYNYYVVVTRDYNVIHPDTVRDNDFNYYGTGSTGNTTYVENIGGPPDNLVATVGANRVSGGGYVYIDAAAVRPASVTVILGE